MRIRLLYRCLTTLFACLCAGAALPATQGTPKAALQVLSEAERIAPGGAVARVQLPLEREAPPGEEGVQRETLRLQLDLGPAPSGQAMYLPGLRAHARIRVNGHVLDDDLAHAANPLPRSVHRIRLVRVPDALLRPGLNQIELDVAGPGGFSVSTVAFGGADAAERGYRRRVLAAVIGPALVATAIACLGLTVLVLWLRRRQQPLYGYFGAGALCWGLHSAWSVLPESPLQGVHHVVWWTVMYSAFVLWLVMFSLRFAGWTLPKVDRALWLTLVSAGPMLYAANAGGWLAPAAEAWRLGCIVIVGIALVAVTVHAVRRRDTGSLLMLVAGVVSFAFGARDWQLAHAGTVHDPIYLTPYAGLLFIALMAWVLVDGFVRTSSELEAVNASLEDRVTRSSAELRRALADMRNAKEQAEAANRAKSRFLAAASHDLRQPIHALGLHLAVISSAALEGPLRDGVQRMSRSLTALGSMFDALLDVSRMDAGVIVPQPLAFDLGALLHRLGDEFAPLAERKGLRLQLRPGLRGPRLQAWGDPVLLERVLRNLLANAVQHTSAGGVLVRWRLEEGAARWNIAVWDTGCGIAAEEQQRVFDEFYQVQRSGGERPGGLGLGLAIVKRLSDLMDLRLALCSKPGRGSRFALSLPATSLSAQRASPPLDEPLPAGCVVAVVEDDEDVRAGMVSLLRRWHCQVVDGASADAVLAAWRASGGPPVQALVADFQLGMGQNGVQAIHSLRRAFAAAALPAIIVTGDSTPPRLAGLAEAGLPWLAKPVAPARLRSWLAAVLGAQTVQGTFR